MVSRADRRYAIASGPGSQSQNKGPATAGPVSCPTPTASACIAAESMPCGRRDLNEQVRGGDHDPRDDSEYARAQQKVSDDGHGTLPIT
jgi:hypothetical protein